ncbi:MAG: prepilin-type N-terminal cleavage/methylation domain-containing protein [Candidatus Omnitrophica bacterium]|nr:prepilin-type N-terminal cleavage/methylation domain-containing protein [Candidatus Omnitrophota bacterium]
MNFISDRRSKTFTLIELMVAISILVLLATGLITAYTSCVLLNLSNNNLTKAANDAQRVLEDLTAVPYADIDTYILPGFNNLPNENVTVNITEISSKKEVIVEVSWTETGRNNNFKLFTIFHE